jgi:hypothetical protein
MDKPKENSKKSGHESNLARPKPEQGHNNPNDRFASRTA